MSRALEDRVTGRFKPADVLILGPIVLLPWLFAGVELWAFRAASMSIVAGAAWVFWSEGAAGVGLERRSLRWLLPAFLLAVFAAVQLVPLPASVQRLLNPHVAAPRDDVAAMVQEAGEEPLRVFERLALARAGEQGISSGDAEIVLETGVTLFETTYPRSLYPAATAEALAWYVALLAAFLAVRGRCRARPVRQVYLVAIGASLTGIAIAALIQRAEWSGSFYGLRRYVGVVEPFGPYINRNNFSGAMELAVPLLIGLGWSVAARAIRRRDRSVGPAFFAFGGAAICFVALAIAASKAAAVILPIAVVGLMVLGARGRQQRRIALTLVAVFLVGAVGVMSFSDVGERMRSHLDHSGEGVNIQGRTGAWLASLKIVADYPLLGVGYGAFSEAYPAYGPPGVSKRWTAAHSDYLEVAVEGGLIAFLLLIWLAVGYTHQVVRSSGQGNPMPRWRLGVALGVAAMACHALVDFNHQIPANGLLFVALAALALPAVPLSPSDPRPQRRVVLPLFCILLVVYGARAFEGLIAGVAHARAVVLEADHWHSRAQRFYRIGAKGTDSAQDRRSAAREYLKYFDSSRRRGRVYGEHDRKELERSARQWLRLYRESPASARFFEGLARVYERLEDVQAGTQVGDGLGRAGTVAVGLYGLASDRAPNWFTPRDRLAIMLWRHGEREEALEAVRGSARVLPSMHGHLYASMKPTPVEVRDAFAEAAWEAMNADPRLRAASFVIQLGEQERLLRRYDRALDVLDLLQDSGADARQRAQGAYIRGRSLNSLGRYDEARESLERAARDSIYEPFAMAELALVADAQGRPDEAQEIRAGLRWLAPTLPGPALDYAATLRESGSLEQALATVRLVVSHHPDGLRGRAMLADLLIRLGDLPEAEAEIVEMETRGMSTVAAQLRDRLDEARGDAPDR